MENHVYKVVEIVGTSSQGVSEAVHNGLQRAQATIRHIGWFETQQIRGRVENGTVVEFQVTMKVGFTLDAPEQG